MIVVAAAAVACCNQNAHFPCDWHKKEKEKEKVKRQQPAKSGQKREGKRGGQNRHIDRLNGVVGFE